MRPSCSTLSGWKTLSSPSFHHASSSRASSYSANWINTSYSFQVYNAANRCAILGTGPAEWIYKAFAGYTFRADELCGFEFVEGSVLCVLLLMLINLLISLTLDFIGRFLVSRTHAHIRLERSNANRTYPTKKESSTSSRTWEFLMVIIDAT